ncbi:hypothetical protein MKX01_020899 [Papaver californicum]|nr:hypothetical protein MKX01_020899 [Papaver californicum]
MATSSRINHLFAILICMSISAEMVLAAEYWFPDICAPGEAYIERNYNPLPANLCVSCTDWCKAQCCSLDRWVVQDECRQVGDWQDCQCCCSKRPPTVPPAPPSRPPFAAYTTGPEKICAAAETEVLIKRDKATDCPSNPLCETKCKEINLFAVRSECLGASRDGKEAAYIWDEQCCCGAAPPPPTPSPPPLCPGERPPCGQPPLPPPTCCGCCPVDVNVQISLKSGCSGDSGNSL